MAIKTAVRGWFELLRRRVKLAFRAEQIGAYLLDGKEDCKGLARSIVDNHIPADRRAALVLWPFNQPHATAMLDRMSRIQPFKHQICDEEDPCWYESLQRAMDHYFFKGMAELAELINSLSI